MNEAPALMKEVPSAILESTSLNDGVFTLPCRSLCGFDRQETVAVRTLF